MKSLSTTRSPQARQSAWFSQPGAAPRGRNRRRTDRHRQIRWDISAAPRFVHARENGPVRANDRVRPGRLPVFCSLGGGRPLPRTPSATQTYGGDLPHEFCIITLMGRHILFKCPRLGTNVQHWLPDTPPADEPSSYASVVCLACSRLHFIHKETGKLLGEN
jgi:hypothetical protein